MDENSYHLNFPLKVVILRAFLRDKIINVEECVLERMSTSLRFPKIAEQHESCSPANDRPHYSAGAYLLNKHLIIFHLTFASFTK